MWDKAHCQVDTAPDEGAKLQDKSELSRDWILPMGQGTRLICGGKGPPAKNRVETAADSTGHGAMGHGPMTHQPVFRCRWHPCDRSPRVFEQKNKYALKVDMLVAAA